MSSERKLVTVTIDGVQVEVPESFTGQYLKRALNNWKD